MKTQSNSGPDSVTTTNPDSQIQTEAQPTQSEGSGELEKRPASPDEAKASVTPQGIRTDVQTPATPSGVTVAQAEQNKPAVKPLTMASGNTRGKGTNTNPSENTATTPDNDLTAESDGLKSTKKDPSVRDGRKYVPSKKAMIDPLKMDMSKPSVIPTSSQLSMQCLECHIIFSDPKSKVRHLKQRHPALYEQHILSNALFACYVCESFFPNSAELMAHQKTHLERKPFKCLICGEAFKRSTELTLHKKIHFGQNGYACTDCGKACKTMTLLKYHRRTHTGEKPYVCKECGKRFTMHKTLQKHILSHTQGEDDEEPRNQEEGGHKRYPCPICQVTFKTTSSRQKHLNHKHALHTNISTGPQVKQSTPIITPLSISQPALLQLEANGPLQKVDANIDTEQIRKLIESLGNVQKVNQVVILGQVPPHAPPLEVQQILQPPETVNLNLNPPQIDFMGVRQPECKTIELEPLNNLCDPMEQTIILEPITPDGQLENPPFPEPDPQMAAAETVELTLVQTEQNERPDEVGTHPLLQQPDISAMQCDNIDQIICQNELDLEQTVVLELTPALIPTQELEQSQTVTLNEILPSTLETTTELEKTSEEAPGSMVVEAPDTSLSIPPLTIELELEPLQEGNQDIPPADPLAQTSNDSKTISKEDAVTEMQTVSQDLIPPVLDEATSQDTKEKTDHEPQDERGHEQEESVQEPSKQDPTEQKTPENVIVESKEGHEKVENVSETEDSYAREEDQPQPEAKKDLQMTELPVNVMSAQELVKVRKRKPARTFFFQGYMHDLAGSFYSDELQIDASPAKRQRRKKPHLVVKFGPQSKEKKSKKQKKPSKDEVLRAKPTVHLSNKKGSPKKGKKGPVLHTEQGPLQDTQEKQNKEDTRKNKKKKQQDEARKHANNISEKKSAASPVSKKKQKGILQKDQPKMTKGGKGQKKMGKKEKGKTKTSPPTADTTGQHTVEDSLLLLKGHKQPQLKVHKLDPSKASGSSHEGSPNESQKISPQMKNSKVKSPASESTNKTKSEDKKKGGRAKKGLSLLSSLKVTRKPPEKPPSKPKTTKKRKASSNVETEGVITSSHSKRALECKDCGDIFSDVPSLHKHKATVHIIESPGLTYTNGNIFEGVSQMDLYQLPQQHGKAIRLMNASTGWDTEPEMGETALEDKERNVSFPALIPSPSLPLPLSDMELCAFEDKGRSNTEPDNQPSFDLMKSSVEQSNVTSDLSLSASTQTQSSETGKTLASDEAREDGGDLKNPGSESGAHGAMDENIKQDLLFKVDLVTVGEQSEKDEGATCNPEAGSIGKHPQTSDRPLTSQTVSCDTNQEEVKEEEEEVSVQKEKGEERTVVSNANKSRGRGTGTQRRASPEDTAQNSEKEQNECQVVCGHQPVTSDSEITEEGGPNSVFKAGNAATSAKSSDTMPCTLETTPDERVGLEPHSVTPEVEKVTTEKEMQLGEENDRDKSPGIIIEKVITSTPKATADKELMMARTSLRQGLNRVAENEAQVLQNQEIKVEEIITNPPLTGPTCPNKQSAGLQPQQHWDIRTVLVKEECSLVLSEAQATQGSSIHWNVEPVSAANTSGSLLNGRDSTRDSCATPEFITNQCIFYPVKEEEREVLVGSAQTNSEDVSTGTSGDTQQTEHRSTDEGGLSDYQEERGNRLLSDTGEGDFADGQAETTAEWHHSSDVQDFLLQSSDEEDVGGFELSDSQLDSEAEVMTYFSKNNVYSTQLHDETSQNSPTTENQSREQREGDQTRSPIDYFSKYFGWDTWVEIANCTNKLSNMSNPVSAREVAQFVGIHIAMGTLKFPSPKLYWEDLTKVPLIAEAMPFCRFLELSRMLKLASLADDRINHNLKKSGQDGALHPRKNPSVSQSKNSLHNNDEMQGNKSNNSNTSSTQTDPLWKIEPLLCRFKAGCLSLRRDGQYAVDRYQLPLTGKMLSQRPSLRCTAVMGFSGLLLHVDLKLGLSGKEDAVEKMVPKGSMVFLCKQELSTPAMLEQLLVAGVHGVGRVGGARGQMGDEFVSSDGKLMLRRSHCGFILSTTGNNQRNMASLIDNFEKAQSSTRLNRDLLKLYSIPLTASAPSCWPQAVLWYLTDLALVNSWLLYRQDHRTKSTPLSFMAFRLEVSKAFILSNSSDTQDSVPPQPPLEKVHATHETHSPSLVEESPLPDAATRYDGSGHWPEQLAEGEGGRCRFGNCQRTSRVLCLKCCVFLCISRNHNCFLNFHSQDSLEKK